LAFGKVRIKRTVIAFQQDGVIFSKVRCFHVGRLASSRRGPLRPFHHKSTRFPHWLTSFAVENFFLHKEFNKSFGFPYWLVSFHYQKYQSVEFIHGRFASATENSIFIELANHFFHYHPFRSQMPTSYLASKPPPNPV
jgi:hypothetical protein